MIRPTIRSIATALAMALVLVLVPDAPASAQQAKCLAGKTGCMAKKAAGLLKCEALAETPGRPADPNAKDCVTKVRAKFDGGSTPAKGCFEKLESKVPNDCLTVDDTAAAETAVDACVAAIVAAIDPPPITQTKCGAGKKKCASKYLAGLLKCRKLAQTPGKPTDPNTKGCVDKAVAKYTGGADPAKGCFAKLQAKSPNDCQSTTDSPTVKALAEDCVADLVAVVMTTATSTTSTTTTTTLACNAGGCPASDQCHLPGVCNPATGACSNPTKPDGAGCNDGNACSQSDTCQAGVCVGSNPVVCGALGPCAECTRSCHPATGQCNGGIAPNGTVCGDPQCTAVPGTCQNGVCTSVPLPDGQPCGDGTSCASCQSGRCIPSTAPDSTVCDDGNPCTVVDLCRNGNCESGRLKWCPDIDPLTHDFCDPATGACVHEADPSRVCPGSPPFFCSIGQKCCRRSDLGFAMGCVPVNQACEDDSGTIGEVCGQSPAQFVCPQDLGFGTCCGGNDCCNHNALEICFQGKCRLCDPLPLCGGTDCCDPTTEDCDFFSNPPKCVPRCGNSGPVCLPSERCCPNLTKCCDAIHQACGDTDCVPLPACGPGETPLPDNSCCITEFVCGNECCSECPPVHSLQPPSEP